MTLGQSVFCDHLLAERSPHTLAEKDIFSVQFHARLIRIAHAAVRIPAKLTGNNAFDFALVPIDQFGTRHARKNFHAQCLGLLGHPATDVAHRHDVIAMIVHQRRHRKIGYPQLARFAQHVKIVFPDRNVQRRALRLPVGNKRIQARGVENGAGQDMRAHFRALLQHDHVTVRIDLLEPDGRRQSRRSSTHDDHIIFHCFAFNIGHRKAPLSGVQPSQAAGNQRSRLAKPRRPVWQSQHHVKRQTAAPLRMHWAA